MLISDNTPTGMVSLGGWGGYIVVGFDHPVVNKKGASDFRIYGNAHSGSAEPGIIMVSCDTNKNGLPDDEWYEIKGSEYGKATEIRDYEITYKRPSHGSNDVTWTDNKNNSGTIPQNSFHKQNYYPEWINSDEMTFRGSRLPDNYILNGSVYILDPFEYGYADNYPNNDERSCFDIDMAIDKYGNKADLKCIDFIKVYTGVNQVCVWIGESSTEFASAEDLHPDEPLSVNKSLAENCMSIVRKEKNMLIVNSAIESEMSIFDITGKTRGCHYITKGDNHIDISSLHNGVYIMKSGYKTIKFYK